MTTLLLAEQLFLLTHDDRSGRAHATVALDNGLAGALLLDLAHEGLLLTSDKAMTAVPGTPSHPLLSVAHGTILKSEKPRSAQYWVTHLPRSMKPLGKRVGQSLAGRGVLSEDRRKVIGLFPATRWPEVDPGPERRLREILISVLVTNVSPDRRTALLISLLRPMGLVRGIVDKEHRKSAQARAKEIAAASADGTGVPKAVAKSVAAAQAAVLTAVMMPVIMSSTN